MAGVGSVVVAVGGFVSLVLRRRGTTRESGHWEKARRLDE